MTIFVDVLRIGEADITVRHRTETSVVTIDDGVSMVKLYLSKDAAEAVADALRLEKATTHVAHPSAMENAPGWDETRQCYIPASRGAA